MNRALFLLAVLTVFLSSAYAGSVFKPHIVESWDDAVCELVLEHYTNQLVSANEIDTQIISSANVLYPSFKTETYYNIAGKLHIAKINNGNDKILISQEIEISRNNSIFYNYYTDEKNKKDFLLSLAHARVTHKINTDYVGRDILAPDLNSNNMFKPFLYNSKWYFLDEKSNYSEQFSNVFLLKPDGATSRVCSIKVIDDINFADKKMTYPFFMTYINLVESIMKSPKTYRNIGTEIYALSNGRYHASLTFVHPRKTMTKKFLDFQAKHFKHWRLIDIWNYRQWMTFETAKNNAITELTRYYMNNFSYSEDFANKLAAKNINSIPAAYYALDVYYDADDDVTSIQQLVKGEIINYKDYLKDYNISFSNCQLIPIVPGWAFENHITTLTFLVDLPSQLDSLPKDNLKSIDNSFSKDLLMYAAHMNNLDTVKKLLSLQWPLYKTTSKYARHWDCHPIKRIHRSALTYAAENASIELIKTLVEAGADTTIKDSQGNTLDFYINLNPRFSAEEKTLGFDGVLKKYAGPTEIKPSFSCSGKLNRIERAICDSEGLSIYDRELATNYKKAMKHEKIAKQFKKDQIRWIGKRNRECKAFEKDFQVDACIARTTRARIRYLEYLLDVVSE